MGVQISPIHRWNEPDRALGCSTLGFGHRDEGGQGYSPPPVPRCVSTPCASTPGWVHGGVGIAPLKQHQQGPGAAQLIFCPSPGAPRQAGDAQGALEGTRAGSSCCPGGPSTWCQPGTESPGWQRAIAASQKSAGVGRVGICQLFLSPMPLAPPAQERGWHCWGTPGLSQAAPSSLGSPSQQGRGQGTQGLSNPLLPSRKGGSSSHGRSHKPPALW